MAIVFPISPSVNDTFTSGSITYKWDGQKWIGLGVTPADRLVEGSNSLEITAGNDLVWTGGGNVGIGTDNPTNAALHVEGRNFSFGGPGNNFSGQGNLYIGNYNNPLLDSWERNIRIASKNQIEIELYTDWDGTQYSDSILFSSPDGLGLQFNGNKGGVNRSGIFPLNYNAGTAITDDYLFFQAGNKYLWFDADTGRLGINRSSGSGWTDTLDVNGSAKINGNLKFPNGNGIDFSTNANAAGMTSEVLTDYEEGEWTPGVSFGNNSVGVTYSIQVGNYTKIGRQVTVTGYLTLSNKGTSTGELKIEGLPFAVRNGSGAYNYQNMFYQNILPSNIHTGKEIMSGGSQWFSPGYFGVDRDHQLNAFEVYTHVRFRRVQTGAYSWCLLFVTSNGGSPPTYTTTFAAVINVPAGGVLGEEIIMPFLNAPGDASLAAGTNQAGVQMLYGAPATDGTATYIGWLSGDGGVGNNGSPIGSIYVDGTQNSNGNIDYIPANTTPTVGTTYGPVSNVNTGTNIHIAVFRDKTGGWCGPQTGNVGGFVVPNTTQINVRTVRNSIIGHENLTDVAVVNNTQLGAFSWTYFTDA